MPVIPVDRVVDKKGIIRKREGSRRGEAQGVTDPPPPQKKKSFLSSEVNLTSYLDCQAS
jgi:hypothetical protein